MEYHPLGDLSHLILARDSGPVEETIARDIAE